MGPNIEVYTFEDEEPDEDESIPWDCDGGYELGDFEFDTEWEEDDE